MIYRIVCCLFWVLLSESQHEGCNVFALGSWRFCKGLGPVSDFHLSPSVIQFPVSALMLSDDRKDIVLNLIRLSLRVAFLGWETAHLKV